LDGVEVNSFSLQAHETYDLSLLCPRLTNSGSIDDRFRLIWRKADRIGHISPIVFQENDLNFLKPSSVRFEFLEKSPASVGEFSAVIINCDLSYERKRSFLYIYVFRETRNGRVELNPNTLLIEGSLIVPVPEDVKTFDCEIGL
jgi:hypothetical protein